MRRDVSRKIFEMKALYSYIMVTDLWRSRDFKESITSRLP